MDSGVRGKIGTPSDRKPGTTKESSMTVRLGRTIFSTQLRYPFKKWQWFTVNSSVSWRDTYYTRVWILATGKLRDTDVNRQYATLLAQMSGPIFTRSGTAK